MIYFLRNLLTDKKIFRSPACFRHDSPLKLKTSDDKVSGKSDPPPTYIEDPLKPVPYRAKTTAMLYKFVGKKWKVSWSCYVINLPHLHLLFPMVGEVVQGFAIIIEQFIRICCLDSFNKASRDEDNILDQINIKQICSDLNHDDFKFS